MVHGTCRSPSAERSKQEMAGWLVTVRCAGILSRVIYSQSTQFTNTSRICTLKGMMSIRRCCNVLSTSKNLSFLNVRAFSTSEGVTLLPTRYTHFIGEQNVAVPASIAPVMSLKNMTSKQVLATKKKEMIDKFQMHHADTGSSQVQKKIISLTKHFAKHKKDKSGYRGYIATIQKRKRLMLHLKNHDPEAYKKVVTEKYLFKEAEQLTKIKK